MIRIFLILLVVAAVAGIFVMRQSQLHPGLLPPATDTKSWRIVQYGRGMGNVSVEDGALRVDVQSLSGEIGGVQLVSPFVPLEPGRRYLLTFQARADQARELNMDGNTGGRGGRYDSLGLSTIFPVGQQWSSCEKSFVLQGNNRAPVRCPVFYLGDKVGTVWLKDIVLEPVG
jgi:hypothetical protein